MFLVSDKDRKYVSNVVLLLLVVVESKTGGVVLDSDINQVNIELSIIQIINVIVYRSPGYLVIAGSLGTAKARNPYVSIHSHI